MLNLVQLSPAVASLYHGEVVALLKVLMHHRWQNLLRALWRRKAEFTGLAFLIEETLDLEIMSFPHPLLGILERAILSGEALKTRVLVEFAALACARGGARNRWEITGVVDRLQLPEFILEFPHEKRRTFRRSCLHAPPGDAVIHPLKRISLHDTSTVIILADDLPVSLDQLRVGDAFASVHPDCSIATTTLAFALLSLIRAPSVGFLLPMIHRVTSTQGDAVFSTSFRDYPGLAIITEDCSALITAELIIHEASHQLFFASTPFELVMAGHDRTLCFSALAGTKRPLRRALLAYHALGNIAAFHASMIAAGRSHQGISERRLLMVRSSMDAMRPGLQSSEGLTAFGRSVLMEVDNLARSMSLVLTSTRRNDLFRSC
jgi:hypothetical protein